MSKFKEYYDDPEYRERYLKRLKEKIECSGCGAIVTRSSYSSHIRTDKHKNNLKKSEEILELEKKRAGIERIYNKKIRALKRRQNRKLEKIDKTINIR